MELGESVSIRAIGVNALRKITVRMRVPFPLAARRSFHCRFVNYTQECGEDCRSECWTFGVINFCRVESKNKFCDFNIALIQGNKKSSQFEEKKVTDSTSRPIISTIHFLSESGKLDDLPLRASSECMIAVNLSYASFSLDFSQHIDPFVFYGLVPTHKQRRVSPKSVAWRLLQENWGIFLFFPFHSMFWGRISWAGLETQTWCAQEQQEPTQK